MRALRYGNQDEAQKAAPETQGELKEEEDDPLLPRLRADAGQEARLALNDANGTVIAANDNWKDSQQADISASGIAPGDDREAAILRVLGPGNYTAVVRGKNDSVGVALVEAYNLGAP